MALTWQHTQYQGTQWMIYPSFNVFSLIYLRGPLFLVMQGLLVPICCYDMHVILFGHILQSSSFYQDLPRAKKDRFAC